MGIIEAGIIGMTTTVALFGYVLFIPFVIMYILEEIRGRRAGDRDPLLGAKLVSTLFLSVAFQVALAGLTGLIASLIDDRFDSESVMKNAIGLLLGGIVAGVMPAMIYRRVAGNGHGRFARQALGVNAIMTGAVATMAVIATSMMLLNDGKVMAVLAVDVAYGLAAWGCARPLLTPETAN